MVTRADDARPPLPTVTFASPDDIHATYCRVEVTVFVSWQREEVTWDNSSLYLDELVPISELLAKLFGSGEHSMHG